MKVLILGSGGREHAIAAKLKQSREVEALYCCPGNAGTASLGTNVPLPLSDAKKLIAFAQAKGIGLTVVGPEAPLTAGIVDRFREAGLAIVGPTAAAAQLEGSKVFAKEFLKELGIPTAGYQVFQAAGEAEAAIRSGRFQYPLVVKADGLAAGKGVLICPDEAEALAAVHLAMRDRAFGSAGDRIVIEEFLEGEETSFMVFSDGRRILPMVPSQDHKAALDGDQGPNTGGMGAFSADFLLSEGQRAHILSHIIEPAVAGMAARGTPFQGVLYAGLMLTRNGPQVLEFNVRLGDPETQVILPRMQTDLLEVCLGMARGDLSGVNLEWDRGTSVCVVLASGGYPGPVENGFVINGLERAARRPGTAVFHAGTAFRDDKVVTSGGRVLGVTTVGPALADTIGEVYRAVGEISFDGMHYRRDIGAKGLRKLDRL